MKKLAHLSLQLKETAISTALYTDSAVVRHILLHPNMLGFIFLLSRSVLDLTYIYHMAVKDKNSLSGMAQFDFFTELVLQACLQ